MPKKPNYNCHDCNAEPGQFHDPGCDMEECPFCHNQLISCDCCYKLLGLNPKKGHRLHERLNSKQSKLWDNICRKKGLIPWGNEVFWNE